VIGRRQPASRATTTAWWCNVDRGDQQREEVLEAFVVKEHVPENDYGSVFITGRLSSLRRLVQKGG